MPSANERQVGGDHYKKGGEEHWDRAWRLKYDPFQYIITKWIERHREKGGLQDLEKARHALDKYIEVVQAQEDRLAGLKAGASNPGERPCPHYDFEECGGELRCLSCHRVIGANEPYGREEPDTSYVNQD